MASETYAESVARLNARIEELEAEIDLLQREVTATYQAYDDMMRCKDEDIAELVKELNGYSKRESEGWMALIGSIPRNVEWPRFEDGEPVKFGDLYVNAQGNRSEVQYIGFKPDGYKVNKGQRRNVWKAYGEPVKRSEPDTQEAIDADVEKEPCLYFNGTFLDKCADCKLHDGENDIDVIYDKCHEAMTLDLLARQRKLLGGVE